MFRKEVSSHMAINSINTVLGSIIPHYNFDLSPKMWHVLEMEMNLRECDIYSFIPDEDSDPYAEPGNIWSFNYFFYNKKLKRILLFSSHLVSKSVFAEEDVRPQLLPESLSYWVDEEMEM
eukprot:TRINITY_DN5219_c0_g1_i2.p1 TRINITY_DN5219_c0_g1~~TRINITY_DN5219_c0_g1_i2.p1  ORF type:complete len:120 (-),score=27.46 TRINITY_DN5219_c0_g1_i2:9-368(-)